MHPKGLQYEFKSNQCNCTYFIDFLGLLTCTELPWIGVSADRFAISGDGEILPIEVKCPETCIGKEIKTDYLAKDSNGDHCISDKDRGPMMMLQVQLQIFFAKAQRGIFVVYSDQGYVQFMVNLSQTLV